MIQHRPIQPARADLPTMYDLPSEDPEESGLPDEFHDFQPKLLRETCQPPIGGDFFVGADLNLYYDTEHTSWYKRPDWFLVLGVPATQVGDDMRWSYVLWQEGAAPFLVIELLSPGTEAEDLGQTLRIVGNPPTKWQVYEQELQVPYYVLFDRSSNNFRLFQLTDGRYIEAEIGTQGFWFPELQLSLGKWSGQYFGIETQWLRWFDRFQQKIPTEHEQAQQAKQLAAQSEQRAVQSEQWAVQSEQRAVQSEQLAAQSEQRAVQLEQRAAQSEQQAAQSEQRAAQSEQRAAQSEQQAGEADQRAEEADQRAEEADQRAERLAAQLRALGIEPN